MTRHTLTINFVISSFTLVMFAGMILAPLLASAATTEGKQFTVGVTVITNDVTPPTTPVNLVATGLTDTSITLSWDPSTDDNGVLSYQIFRDGVAVATSTDPTFTDTGLTSLTSYMYTVRAYDIGGNYSGMSATTTATTLAPSHQGSSSETNNSTKSFVRNLSVEVGIHDATIRWTTDMPTIGRLLFGKTDDYESGSLAESQYSLQHETKLNDLTPNTRYYFQIVVRSQTGDETNVGNQTFVTLQEPDTTPPANPSRFTAVGILQGIALSWRNPSDSDFASVRLVRSDKFYPTDIFDGKVVYEGGNESYLDTDTQDGTVYYYTIFALDKNGNYSSGAIARATRKTISGGQQFPPQLPPQEPFTPATTSTTSTTSEAVLSDLDLSDFEFVQKGTILAQTAHTVNIDASAPLTVRLAYDRVPEILKVVAITLVDPQDADKAFSFLLRIDKKKEYFTATIDTLGRSGIYPMHAAVVDFKNKEIKRLQGALIAHLDVEATGTARARSFVSELLLYGPRFLSLLILLLVLLFILSRILRKRQEEKEEREKQEEKNTLRDTQVHV